MAVSTRPKGAASVARGDVIPTRLPLEDVSATTGRMAT
jgi:hypothetical protein